LAHRRWRIRTSKASLNTSADYELKNYILTLGIDPSHLSPEGLQNLKNLFAEAYEITAFTADDPESLDMLTQFGKDYAGAQSTIEWAEFAGGGVFEIVLTALLLMFTGGIGNAVQGVSKIRHAGKLKSLGSIFRNLGRLLRRKKLQRKVRVEVDTKKTIQTELPEDKKVSSKPEPEKKPVRTVAQDREEVSRLSRESSAARKAGNTALADAKLAEARNILRPHIPKGPDDSWDGVIDRLDVQAPKDGAVFWSGNQVRAQNFAESIGGTTLEGTPGGNVINGWDEINNLPWDAKKGPPPWGGDLWNGVSKKFANGATGHVNVIQTPAKLWDQGTVWHNTEKNILMDKMMDGSVSNIDIHTITNAGKTVKLSPNYVNELLRLEGISR